jgi:hypothetical protein
MALPRNVDQDKLSEAALAILGATCQLIKVTLVEIAWQLPPDQGHAVKRRRGQA